MQEVINMNTYLQTLEKDINRVHDLSRICRGEWCRRLESQVDDLLDEVRDMEIHEADFETSLVHEMSFKLMDAYKHLAPDIHI
jgi:hypothetical protein